MKNLIGRIELAKRVARSNLDYVGHSEERIEEGIYIMAALGYYLLIEDVEGIKKCRENIKKLGLPPIEDAEESMIDRARAYLDLYGNLRNQIAKQKEKK